jgi:HD-GYP domain-containing protein (c-di-GMP phosphodiesterase class II)
LGQAVHRLFPDVHAQYISNYHPEIEQITCVYAVLNGAELNVDEFPAVALDHSPKATQSQAILQREPFIIDDLVAHRGGAQNIGQLVGSGQMPRSALYVPMLSNNNVLGVVQVQSTELNRFNDEDARLLAVVANAAATVLQNARVHRELIDAYDQTLEGWGFAVDLRDKETEGHSLRVATLTRRMAICLGIQGDALTDMWRGALLHDVGKLGVPDSVLLKPGVLDSDEWEQMRMHPQLAYDMLQSISFLKGALDIPYAHHEWWDGSGYPRGLQREQIPLSARIFAYVDVWDAVTSNRLYRKAWSREKAIEHIQSCTGTHLDPHLHDAFLQVIAEK